MLNPGSLVARPSTERVRRFSNRPKRVCLGPKPPGHADRVDSGFAPPRGFITGSVHLAVVAAAQRDDELVAHLAPEPSAAPTEDDGHLRACAHKSDKIAWPRICNGSCPEPDAARVTRAGAGERRAGGLWGTPHPQRGTARTPPGPNPRQDWLSCRQGSVERPRVRDLAGQELALPSWEHVGGLARQVGDEPDADQRVDAEIPPSGAASRGRCSGASGGWRVEVGGFAALHGVVGGAHEGMDGCGSVPARHHAGADRRHPHR